MKTKLPVVIISFIISLIFFIATTAQTYAELQAVPVPQAPQNQRDKYQTNLFTGSAEYTYSIQVPKGTDNLTPTVSLSYNNQSAHALPMQTGDGWEVNRDYIQRDVNFTPSDTSDDKYKLHFNGTTYDLVYNPTDSLFHTKIESHLKIQQFLSGGQGSTGMYWQVTNPDGTIYRFGYASDSELVCNGQSYDGYWNVDQVTDIHGNHIYYAYTSSNGVAYLSQIKYNNDQLREIDFAYATNPYQMQQYIQGCNVTESSRLSNIQVKANGNLVHEYDLGFNPATNSQNLLSSITEKGNDGTSTFPATTLSYNSEVQSWNSNYQTWAAGESGVGGTLGTDTELIDINGDGLPDVVKEGGNEWRVWLNTGNSLSTSYQTWAAGSSGVGGTLFQDTELIDVNGDGLPDVVKEGSNEWRVWLNTGSAWSTSYQTWAVGSTGVGGTLFHDTELIDVNGDGLPDVVKEGSNEWRVWLNTGSSWSTTYQTWAVGSAGVGGTLFQDTELIDVNDDGLPDVVKEGNGEWRVWLNTGNAWLTTYQTWAPGNASVGGTLFQDTVLEDVNGDGLTDVVKEGSNNDTWYVWLNTGSSWLSQVETWSTNIPTGSLSSKDTIISDINGDGLPDIVKQGSDWRAWINSGYAPDVLSSIQTEQRGTISFNYTSSTKFPNTALPFPLWVVSQMTVNNGMSNSHGTNDSTTYNYKNGLYSWQNRELRGFGEVDETDPNGSKKQTFFKQDDGLKGMLYQQKVTDSQGNPYTETDDTWNSSQSNSIYTNTLTSEKKYTYDGSASNPKSTETDYEYDQYGNVTKKSELGDTNVTGDERFTHTQYTYNTSSWIINKPYDTYVNGSDDSTKAKETWDYYDNNTGLTDTPTKGDLTKEVQWLSGGTNPTATYTYDSYGNKTQQTDANNHATQYTYGVTDTTHTYPEETTNAKNQTTTTTYDLGTGNILSKTGPNGFTTSYSYDVFGRVSKEIDPYDSSNYPTKSYTYYDSTSAPQGTLISQRTVSGQAGTLDTYTFVDGLGRTLQTRTPAEDTNKQIVLDTFYDSTGKVAKQSVPHLDALSTTYTTPLTGIEDTITTYDPIARIMQITNPQGTTKTTSYDHWKQTDTDENSHQKKEIMDAYGNILEVDESHNGQTYETLYDYDPLNYLTKITDLNNNTFNFSYDTLGRKVSQTDPDLGTWTYTYDGAGNMTQQKDNRNKTTTKQYDELNRITEVTYPNDPTESYTYDGNSKIGTLTSVTDDAGTVSYSYDNRLRKTQEQRVTNGITWTTGYSYDAADRLVSTTKPDDEVVTNTFDAQGEIASVSGVLTNIDYNALDKETSKTFENGQTTNYTYNTDDFRLSRIQTGSVQDIGYTYDNVGNVKSRTDNLLSKTQFFTYDDLDRLTNATESAGFNFAYSYDPIGNLASFTGSGTQTDYTYGQNTLVHAITSATSTTTIYDDSLAYGWTDASFNTTNSTTAMNVYSGSTAISAVIGANGGLDFQAPRDVSTNGYTYLHFALKSSQDNQQYKAYVDSTFGEALSTPVSLANYGGQPNASGWTAYNIPLEDLGATDVSLGDVVLYNATASDQPAVYVDEVKFMSGAVPTPIPTVTPTPTSSVTPTPTPTSENIAPNGTAYRWWGLTSSTSDSNKTEADGLNDGNTTVDVPLADQGDDANEWEAAGVIWTSTQDNVTSIVFKNGTYRSDEYGNGVYTANVKLQFTTDGSTWTDSGWSISPSYAYDSSDAGGATYIFTGTAASVKGIRVIGQVHTDGANSWYVNAREVQAMAENTEPSTTNIASTGTGYRWNGLTSSTSDSNRSVASGMNDGDYNTDVPLADVGDDENEWEAGGVVWSMTQNDVTSVTFKNGTYRADEYGNGVYGANFKLQFTTDGTTWVDSGWTSSPSYAYDSSSAGGTTYTFSGSATSIKGARVIGQVHVPNGDSWYVNAREMEVITTSETTPTPTQTNSITPTPTPSLINIAPNGTGSTWWGLSTSTSDSNKVAATGINDGDMNTDVPLATQGDDANEWEAAGVTWSTTQNNVTKVEYTNGSYLESEFGNGVFAANFKLQFTTDGTTWTDASWGSSSPTYDYDSSAADDKTYTFTGSGVSIKGARVVGQVHTGDGSWYAFAREVKIYSSSD